MRTKLPVFMMLAVLMALPLSAAAQEGGAAPNVEVAVSQPSDASVPLSGKKLPLILDEELARRHKEFTSFARVKIGTLNRNHRLSRSRMTVEKMADGTWKARYHQIEQATMTCQVRRSASKTVPYVGVLSYKEHVYEATGASPTECRQGAFQAVRIIPNKHIFSYRKGGWK